MQSGSTTHYSDLNAVHAALLRDGGEEELRVDAAMDVAREAFDSGRPVRGIRDLEISEHGSINYHCAECRALLIRHAGSVLPDVIVLCPVCLTLNEAPRDFIPLQPRHGTARFSLAMTT